MSNYYRNEIRAERRRLWATLLWSAVVGFVMGGGLILVLLLLGGE